MSEINSSTELVVNSRGQKLFRTFYKAENAVCSLLIVHGVGEHSGRYDEFARYLAARRINIVTFDLAGYGRSEGKKGFITDFSDFTSDVAFIASTMRKELGLNNIPLFLMGHSLGGLIALRTATQFEDLGLKGLISIGVPFKLKVSVPGWWRRLLLFLAEMLPWLHFEDSSIKPNMLTHDEEKLQELSQDKYHHYKRSLRFIREYFRNAHQSFTEDGATISCPFLLLQGGDDSVVCPKAVKDFYDTVIFDNKKLIIYPGMYHEVLNETDRARVYEDILEWIRHEAKMV